MLIVFQLKLAISLVNTSPSPGRSLVSTDFQMQKVRRLVDEIHTQYHDDWLSTIIMDSADFSASYLSNLNALENAGKGTHCGAIIPKYLYPLKYSTHDEFDGNWYKSIFMAL